MLFVCVNFTETAGRTNMQLGMIDYHFWISVIVGSWRHDDVTIKGSFSNLHLLTEKDDFLLKQKPASDQQRATILLFRGKIAS